MVAIVLDVLEGAAITLLAVTILHHCWTHTQALNRQRPADEDEMIINRADWAELLDMLRLCEAHCSDGFLAEKTRALIARYDDGDDNPT